jgi:hypothetical protein
MSEMTQDEIKYINMDSNHLSGWLWNAPFKSLGNVIHWIYTYSNLHIAESIQVGNNVVELYGKKIADIECDLNLPIRFGSIIQKIMVLPHLIKMVYVSVTQEWTLK